MTLMHVSERLMLGVCCVHGMAVRLMCHKNRTPNPCSERTDSNMGLRHRKAGNTNREHWMYRTVRGVSHWASQVSQW